MKLSHDQRRLLAEQANRDNLRRLAEERKTLAEKLLRDTGIPLKGEPNGKGTPPDSNRTRVGDDVPGQSDLPLLPGGGPNDEAAT